MKGYRIWPFLLATLTGCIGPITPGDRDYDLADAELRVAFVGNSLTYVQDVPGLVQAMADADGRSMSHVSITAPNVSLEDHWAMGTPDVLRELEPDVVVMQQGPSSLPDNRVHLGYWAGQMDAVIRGFGGRSALYMVWPSTQRMSAFPEVYRSYRLAAERVGGLFIPAGQTWVESWALDPSLAFYSTDGFHPSRLGALAAARTIYAALYGLDAADVPALDSGLDSATEATLRAGLAASLARAREGAPDTAAPPDSQGVDVLFVGNSLTFSHDIPGLVQALAEATGRTLTQKSVIMAGASLEEHWNGATPDTIRALRPGVVVMQQGPSSLPESRDHLIHWTRRFDGVIREAGGEPALFMVWPSLDRKDYFGDVWASYKAAADSVDGVFIPAGRTWLEAWGLDPGLELYGPDNFHPGYLGALAAAQTIFAVLCDVPPDSVPALDDSVDSTTLSTLRAALARSLDAVDDTVAPMRAP